MPHPLINKTDSVRQAGLGLGLGLIAVFVLAQLMPNDPYYNQDMVFDSEVISLAPSTPSITEDEGDLTNPSIDEDNATALDQMDENARHYPYFAMHKASLTTKQINALQNNTPTLSVIVNNVGQSRSIAASILEKLPNDITIALSPYTRNHNEVVKQFDEYGFETWIDLSAITLKIQSDKGRLALDPTANFERNINLLTQQLENKDNIAGVVLPNQSLITETPRLWGDIVFDLFANGYGILDNTKNITKPDLFFHEDKRAPYIKGDFLLEETMTRDQMKSMLSNIRKKTIEQGKMIVTITPSTPATLDILDEWLNSLDNEGITLVPLSAQAIL